MLNSTVVEEAENERQLLQNAKNFFSQAVISQNSAFHTPIKTQQATPTPTPPSTANHLTAQQDSSQDVQENEKPVVGVSEGPEVMEQKPDIDVGDMPMDVDKGRGNVDEGRGNGEQQEVKKIPIEGIEKLEQLSSEEKKETEVKLLATS